MALAHAEQGLALGPPAPLRGQAVDPERVHGRAGRGDRPEASVGRGAVALHVAGAGLEDGRGQHCAGADGGDERLDEPGPGPRAAPERDTHVGGSRAGGAGEGGAAAGRAIAAMDRDVALEPCQQGLHLGPGGVVDDDHLDVLGQVAGDERLDLRPERDRVVAGDEQDRSVHAAAVIATWFCQAFSAAGSSSTAVATATRASAEPIACRATARSFQASANAGASSSARVKSSAAPAASPLPNAASPSGTSARATISSAAAAVAAATSATQRGSRSSRPSVHR